jgi:hypothetical protein
VVKAKVVEAMEVEAKEMEAKEVEAMGVILLEVEVVQMMPDQLLLILKVIHIILVLLQQDLEWLEDRSQVWMLDQGHIIHSLAPITLLVHIIMMMMVMMMVVMMMTNKSRLFTSYRLFL